MMRSSKASFARIIESAPENQNDLQNAENLN